MKDHKEQVSSHLYVRFVRSLLFASPMALAEPRSPGDLTEWNTDDLARVIEIASAQLASQRVQLERLLTRAQLLFTTLLAIFALIVGLAPGIWSSTAPVLHAWIPRSLFAIGVVLLGSALTGAAAALAVPKTFCVMDATVLSHWSEFDLRRFAREYVECVGPGQETNNAHLTVFGEAVRLTVYGALAIGVSWSVGYLPS